VSFLAQGIYKLIYPFSTKNKIIKNVEANSLTHSLIIRYTPEQLFDVVAAVDYYHDFVPWCQRSEIVKRNPDGSFDAELEIGFKFLVESYVSHVELEKAKRIKVFDLPYNFFGCL